MPESNGIKITLNGLEAQLPPKANINDAIVFLKVLSPFVAAELNGDIIEKSDFSSTLLTTGDVLEIIQPLGGGNR